MNEPLRTIAAYGVESLLEDLGRSSKEVDRYVAASDEISRTASQRSAARRIRRADMQAQMSMQMWSSLISFNARIRH